MIVRDEAANIGRCLVSVRSVADQIVVVDTGSKDHTKAIAKMYGAEVYDYEWKDDFAAARNYSLSKARGRWALWLDGDDEVPAGTIERIRKIVATEEPRVVYFALMSGYGEDSHDEPVREQARLFPLNLGIRFVCNVNGRLHESVGQNVKVVGELSWKAFLQTGLTICHHESGSPLLIPAEHCPEEIRHWGYVDPAVLARKIDRNIRLRMIGMGFDSAVTWFWFQVGKYRCVYSPNVLTMWDRLNPIAMAEPFQNTHVPLDEEARREAVVSAAIELATEIEKEQKRLVEMPKVEPDAAINDLVEKLKNISAGLRVAA
jgi:glycosyltransferase involved in cell wall biosynthesis